MDHETRSIWDRQRVIRLAKIAMLIVMGYLVLSLGPPWFQVYFPVSLRRRIVVRLLLAIEVTYGVLLVSVPAALLALSIWLLRAPRRDRRRRPWLIRGLAMSASVLLGLALAEGSAWAWLAWTSVPMPRLTGRFPDPPGESRVDIVVLGAVEPRGVPYQDWLSVGEIVAWKLREAFPDRRFPVEYLARPGLTLDKVHFWMASLERRPDLVILYAGHNEFQMRYDWGHATRHYRDETPPTRVTLEDLARKYSPLCRLIQQTMRTYRIALPPPPSVKRQLVDVPAYTEEEYATRLNDFRTRLEAMTAYCERLGAQVVLVIPPGNDADFEPNRSFLPPQTTRAERDAFAAEFRAARRAEEADPAAAIAAYRALLARQPGFAEAHYRLARLLEATGQPEEADRQYVAARDCDGFPMRCTSDFQDAYRDVAAGHPGAILIDGPAVLRGLSPRGVVGDDFCTDGFHPSLIGYTGLARAILQGLHARHALGWPESSPSPEVSPADCAEHFRIPQVKWKVICDFSAWFYHMTSVIRFDPTARLDKSERYRLAGERIRDGSPPEAVAVPGVGTLFHAPDQSPRPIDDAHTVGH